MNNHAIGQEVLVIYDPQNPQDTILQRDINDYSDRPRNEDVRRYALYGAYLSGTAAGAVVFPAALNLLFARRQPRPELNKTNEDAKSYASPLRPS